MAKTTKEIFSVNGNIRSIEVETDFGNKTRHTFIPDSQNFMRDSLNRIPIGTKISVKFSEFKATRSQAQLAYHFVLMKYLSEHTGNTPEEMHDAVMRLKFGTKKIKLGNREVEVRKSISEKAHMSKSDTIELIDYDLKLCEFLGVNVPTTEQLGYISNDKPYHN